ncbi:hypothetical protein ACFSLT_31240 [Novosphingobium resinovorum]
MSGPLTLKRHQDLRHDGADLNKAVGLIGTPEEVRDPSPPPGAATFRSATRCR